MAAVSKEFTEAGRPSSSSSRNGPLSHGRGGAGNIGNSSAEFDPLSLQTPTIKGDIYTTGRGGSGNMAKNTDAEAARRAQDVEGTPRRQSNSSSHVGRGGAANVFKPTAEDILQARKDNVKWESAVEDDTNGKPPKGFADRGKDWLFGKK